MNISTETKKKANLEEQ